ncbi:hypothetical protein H8B02_27695 [Bradyrhizobium sp. Pear77]|uniref:hypothetical protein n=1 Tax=Bradyrhizobium altum TaxID=1571202 RepID=UPI001E4F6730|nr:hypothetical protein [Bradyrhizobium altum]MCC8957081.1 hypothetical protein [Bradyrhizobium altum]
MFWFLRNEPDAEQRGKLFLDAIAAAKGLSAAALLMSLDEESREKPRQDGYLLLSDAPLEQAKIIWTQKAGEMFRQDPDSVLGNEHFGSLLHDWQRWQGNNVGGQWLSEVIVQDRALVRVLQAFTSEGQVTRSAIMSPVATSSFS